MTVGTYLLSIVVFLLLDLTYSDLYDAWTDSQIVGDPLVQQLRQFAEIHRAKTNNTNSKEILYLVIGDNPKMEYPQLSLQNITSIIITMSGILTGLYRTNLHFSDAYVLLFLRGEYIYYILRGKLDYDCPILTWFKFLLYLDSPLYELERRLSLGSKGIIFNIWNPFLSDIIGFGINKKSVFNNPTFTLIHRNQTSGIDTTNQRVVAYIRDDFFKIIAKDMPETTKAGFTTLMLFTIEQNEANSSNITVGFRVPQYCNRNGVSPMEVYFDSYPMGDWITFGSFRMPNSTASHSTCLIERISYISYDSVLNHYYKSYASVEYCPPTTLQIGSSLVELEVAAVSNPPRFPKSFYIDRDLHILFGLCKFGQPLSIDISLENLINTSSFATNQTLMLYKSLADSFYVDYLNAMFQLNSETTYIDIYLYIINVAVFSSPSKNIIPLFKEAMKRLQSQAEFSKQIYHLAVLVQIPLETYDLVDINLDSERSTFVFQTISDTGKNGNAMALSSDNIIQPLPYKYPIDRFIPDENVDVIIQLSKHRESHKFLHVPDTAVIFTDKFYYEETNISITKVVGVTNLYSQYDRIDVYLKVFDGSNYGFWQTIDMSNLHLVFIFISKHNQNICNSTLMWNILSLPESGRLLFRQSYNIVMKPVDILSQLSILLNAKSSRNYYKNYNILTGIKITTSILSIIGISCMFLTCLLFKGWLKQRIYTNQLCISLLIQAIFFLLTTDVLNHFAYVLFYYSILTQFVWMAFASYVQYVKFIKVFGNPQLDLTKSLSFGWGVPALITTASTVIYRDCLKCEFCSKNDEIFKYFVVFPIILIIACNIGVYIAVMINLWRSEIQESHKKYRIRATVAMPFMLGLVWIVLASVMAPDPIVSLIGWYLFYFIIPSQGFMLFVFMVLLDEDTRRKWSELLRIKRKII